MRTHNAYERVIRTTFSIWRGGRLGGSSGVCGASLALITPNTAFRTPTRQQPYLAQRAFDISSFSTAITTITFISMSLRLHA